MTYSRDFREKVLFIKDKEFLSFAKIAKRFDVGIARGVRGANNIGSKKTPNKPPTIINRQALKKDVIIQPFTRE